MKTMNISDGIKFDAKIFVIPNSAGKVSDFFDPEQVIRNATEVCEANGITFDPENDYLIETWYHSKQLGCDNIPDHNIYFEDEEGNKWILGSNCGRYLPAKLFEGHKEGDTITIKLPMWLTKNYSENSEDVIAEINLTLQQQGYRYQRFGDFEEVVEYVIRYRMYR